MNDSTATPYITLKVKEAWWLKYYLRWVMFRSIVTLTGPDMVKVQNMMDKAITVEVIV